MRWSVYRKITGYGESLKLFCNVPYCCTKYAGWDLWNGEEIPRTLFIDVKTHKKPASSKYGGEIKDDGYILIIKNLTKEDLTFSYACVYDNTIGDTIKLLADDVFKGTCKNMMKTPILSKLRQDSKVLSRYTEAIKCLITNKHFSYQA